MRMEPLYKIANTYLLALENLTNDKELPIEAINDTLEAIEGEFEEKAVNIAAYIKTLEKQAEMVELAREELKARQERLEKAAQNLRKYLKFNMQKLDIHSIQSSAYFRIAVRKNPPRVVIDNEADIPVEFRETKLIETINRAAIREALANGNEVPGAHIEQETNLTIG